MNDVRSPEASAAIIPERAMSNARKLTAIVLLLTAACFAVLLLWTVMSAIQAVLAPPADFTAVTAESYREGMRIWMNDDDYTRARVASAIAMPLMIGTLVFAGFWSVGTSSAFLRMVAISLTIWAAFCLLLLQPRGPTIFEGEEKAAARKWPLTDRDGQVRQTPHLGGPRPLTPEEKQVAMVLLPIFLLLNVACLLRLLSSIDKRETELTAISEIIARESAEKPKVE